MLLKYVVHVDPCPVVPVHGSARVAVQLLEGVLPQDGLVGGVVDLPAGAEEGEPRAADAVVGGGGRRACG